MAGSPPEARGLRRDEVRLMVATSGGPHGTRFSNLPDHLRRGDVVVVNTSPTMPAAVRGWREGREITVHFSQLHDDGTWTVELRRGDRSGPIRDGAKGETCRVPGGSVTLLVSADRTKGVGVRLWRARADISGGVRRLMRRHGAPIRYGYVSGDWPLDHYQTIFADRSHWPGSAEMASAARPFSRDLVERLQSRGVRLVPVVLDAGVSSLESGEAPPAEAFSVGHETAVAVNRARADGGRVIAVGTTVTRALESSVDEHGEVHARAGWTSLVLGPDHPTEVIDGLVTGWHPPGASHVKLLEAVAGSELVDRAYQRAVEEGYLWHEFGDSCFLLP